jgi:hypothetical protein
VKEGDQFGKSRRRWDNNIVMIFEKWVVGHELELSG